MTEFITLPKGHKFTKEESVIRRGWAAHQIKQFKPFFELSGYGLATLGSMVRDIDIIAVPWAMPMKYKTADLFVMALANKFDLQIGNHGTLLHGHRWFALWHKGRPDMQVDLKVMLPAKGSSYATK